MYLGIDLGTSEIKFLLLDDRNHVVTTSGESLTVSNPQPLWSEQNPHDWWAATERGLAHLAATFPLEMASVRAIGLSGQMHGAVLLDTHDTVLRPAILWNDGRSGAQCATLERRVPSLSKIAGNLAMPGFTAPKLLWVREHEPEVFVRTARVLLPKDWLRLKLCGAAFSDFSDASGTLWLDVGARRWSDELLAATGLDTRHMPQLVEGSQATGLLFPALARRWGLPPDVVIAGGAGDNAASAVGMGLVRPGQGFLSLGTSGVIFVITDQFLPNPAQAMHAFCHAVPDRWHQMSVMLSAASAVTWAVRNFGFADEAALIAAAATLSGQARDHAPIFLPYLSGERTPHNNAHAQAVLFGLTTAHERSDMAYAIVEGVTFGLLDGFHTLSLPRSSAVLVLSVVGGGSRSTVWTQLLADALGVTLTTHDASTAGAALGAARLAWLATGATQDEVCTVPAVKQRFVPRASEHQRLQHRYQRYRALYPALRDQFS
jgi:xylulokinase